VGVSSSFFIAIVGVSSNMLNELPRSTNELPVRRVAAQFSEVARSGKFGFVQRLVDGRGRSHVCLAYFVTIIVSSSGVAMVPL